MIRILICTGCEKRAIKCTCTTGPNQERAPFVEMDLFSEDEVGDFLDKTLDRVLEEMPETAALVRSIRAQGVEGIHPKTRHRARPRSRQGSVKARPQGRMIA